MGEAMNDMAKNLSDEDAKQASEWFAGLKPHVWQKVVETDRVPKTFINQHLMRMPLPGGGDEPIGNRIIELPQYCLCTQGQLGQRQGIRDHRRRRKNNSMRDLPRTFAQRLGRSAADRGPLPHVSFSAALLF
jgi:hypothetical protein